MNTDQNIRNNNVAGNRTRPQGTPRNSQTESPKQRPNRPNNSRRGAPRHVRGFDKKTVIIISLSAIAAVFVICFIVGYFIGVQSIEVTGADLASNDEIIEASGITEGSGYFSYNTSKIEESILEKLPCISEVEVKRTAFGKVSVAVKEKPAYWYTQLFGECYVLSEDLEVILITDNKAEIVARGLVRLDFPKVDSALLGRIIEISDEGRDCSFIGEFLSDIRESEIYKEGRLDGVFIETKFEIFAVCDLKYKIILGKYSSAKLKLDTARLAIADESFSGDGTWSLDVSSLPKVVTRQDNELDFSYLLP